MKKHELPKEYVLRGHHIVLRPLRIEDTDPMVAFARRLPPNDLLFLHQDITQQTEIEAWSREANEGNLITIVAWEGSDIQGYATFDRGRAQWRRHVAEIRVVVGESVRRIGVGRLLLEMAFEIALEAGVLKVVARMTPYQTQAVELFRRLGFELEATLRDHAMGVHGCTHDLLVYSYFALKKQQQCCDSCGDLIMGGLTLDGSHLCTGCYNTKYAELGGGD
jgi:RimJ/RimL family protein N-acetyltransferase